MGDAAVVYCSGIENTKVMADEVLKGLIEAGMDGALYDVAGVTPEKALEYDVLALGCPPMGAKELEDTGCKPFYEEVRSQLKNRKLALFGSSGWGQGQWMQEWYNDAKDAGAILCGSEGLLVSENLDNSGREACKQLGASLAKM